MSVSVVCKVLWYNSTDGVVNTVNTTCCCVMGLSVIAREQTPDQPNLNGDVSVGMCGVTVQCYFMSTETVSKDC